ncbi:polysaccharide pyruvyl transferase family protein [Parapedobacter deserti]|uniref:Polysaccharide pyruvyl transferase family protein n=1 Tax=Parapedobacter deserti TaxID=1912957 RepID=A0ABV7JQ45_9SPHI
MLKKIKKYVLRAYFYGHFPSFWQLYFSKKRVLAYYGFLGDRNFGDELVFESAKTLFSGTVLLPVLHHSPLYVKLYRTLFKRRIAGIVVGGGTLIGPYFAEKRFIRSLNASNTPIFFHGTGVTSTINFEELWNHMLVTNSFGGIRGKLSYERILAAVKKQRNIIGDACFCMYDPVAPKEKPKKVLINFGAHHLFDGREHSKNELIKFSRQLVTEGYEVHFLPLHEIDCNEATGIKAAIPELRLLPIPRTFTEAKQIFSDYLFAAGLRLHFIAIAALCHVPFIAINYKDKHDDLLGSIGLEEKGSLPAKITADHILSSFRQRETFDWPRISGRLIALKAVQEQEAANFFNAMNS